MHSILAQQQNNNVTPVVLILLAVFMLLFLLVIFIVVFRYGRIWLRCVLSGAKVSLTEIILMSIRKCPPALICDARIMSVQAEMPVSTAELQRAHLSGVDVELAVRAMIRAKQIGAELSWQDAVSQAKQDQYDDYRDNQGYSQR